MGRWRAIDASQRAEIAGEGRHTDLQIGADGGNDLGAEAEEVAVLVQREFGVRDVVARLRVAEERFRARRDPFDRTAGDLGAEQHQRHFVINGGLHAEAAADIAADDANLVIRHFQNVLRQLGLKHIRALQGRVDGVAAVDRLKQADAAARLHRGCGHAVDHEMMFDHMRSLGEGGIGRLLVAFNLNETDVVGAVVPHQRHARLDGVAGRSDRRQWLVVDFDHLGSIDRLVVTLGDHEGHIVADHSHAILNQSRIARPITRGAVAALKSAGYGQIAKACRLVVRSGQHREHTRCGLRLGGVD